MANVYCLATVPPYWNSKLSCTSEICHRPLPCPVHGMSKASVGDIGDQNVTGPITSFESPIEVCYREYQDSRPEAYYYVKIHDIDHGLTPERAIDLYNKLGSALRTYKDLVENWRGVVIKNPERFR